MARNIVLATLPSHTHRTSEENMGIGYLAAVLRKADYLVAVIDGWLLGYNNEQIARKILEIPSPVFVGLSCYECSLEDASITIAKLRADGCNAPIIGGGYGPTFHEEEFLHIGFNFVIRGEAEESILQLARALENKKVDISGVSGLSWLGQSGAICRNNKSAPVANLDSLPFPARDTIAKTMARKNPIHLVTSRGCQAACLFCSVASFIRDMHRAPSWRSRSISNIVDEIAYLHETFGVSCFKIVDDSFIESSRDIRWIEDFVAELIRRNLSIIFRTQIRSDRITEEIVEILTGVGWFATSIGVENGSPTALKRMNKTASVEQNKQSLQLLEQYGVYVQMGMILFDHETIMMELEENLEFLSELNWPVTKGIFTEMYAAEGTPFARMLVRRKLVTDRKHGNYSYGHRNMPISLVHGALKGWHRSHSAVYDRAINPIGAPKVLPKDGYSEYHKICLRLYRMDLAFFSVLLDSVKSDPNFDSIMELTESRILDSQREYLQISGQLELLDKKYGLVYDAESNPFLD